MAIKIVIYVLALIFGINEFCFSQSVLVQGKLKNWTSRDTEKIYLYLIRGKSTVLTDSVLPDKEGKFTINHNKKRSEGFYRIGFRKGKYTEFIAGNQAVIIDETDVSSAFKYGFNIKNKETDAMLVCENLKNLFSAKVDSLFGKTEKFDEFDQKYYTKLNERERVYEALKSELNSGMKTIVALFPGTFAADVMTKLYAIPQKSVSSEYDSIYETNKSFLYRNYLLNVNLSDERFINNPYIEEFMFTLLSKFTPLTEDGFKNSVNYLIKNAGENLVTRTFIISYLTELFAEKGPPELLQFMNDSYLSSCESNISTKTTEAIKKLNNLAIGKKAPDFSAPDINFQTQSLSKLLGTKATLVYFWSSKCSHCRELTPKYYESFQKFSDKGLKVVAFSLDTDFSSWMTFIQEKKLAWNNLSDLKGWKSSAVELYMVDKTPYSFLLNSNGEIIKKDLSTIDFEKELQTIFE